jgi:hypothetical protein
MFEQKDDGKTHINISRTGKTVLGRLLYPSNFTPFYFNETRFNSLLGFIYSQLSESTISNKFYNRVSGFTLHKAASNDVVKNGLDPNKLNPEYLTIAINAIYKSSSDIHDLFLLYLIQNKDNNNTSDVVNGIIPFTCSGVVKEIVPFTCYDLDCNGSYKDNGGKIVYEGTTIFEIKTILDLWSEQRIKAIENIGLTIEYSEGKNPKVIIPEEFCLGDLTIL